jgi:hypothetical protein
LNGAGAGEAAAKDSKQRVVDYLAPFIASLGAGVDQQVILFACMRSTLSRMSQYDAAPDF